MSAAVLVLNACSSSIKFTLFPMHPAGVEADRYCEGQIDHIGDKPKLHAVDGAGTILVDEALPAVRRYADITAASGVDRLCVCGR